MKTRAFNQHLIFSKTSKKLNTGFTLIELLVVISIISLVSSVILSNVKTARERAIDSAALSSLKRIGISLQNCFLGNGNLLTWSNSRTGGGNICSNTTAETGTWPPAPNGYLWRQVNLLTTQEGWYLDIMEDSNAPLLKWIYCNAASCGKMILVN